MSKLYRIYGKHGNQKQFRAMDLRNGVQVGNLIYATILQEAEKDKIMAKIPGENPDWTFEARAIQQEGPHVVIERQSDTLR